MLSFALVVIIGEKVKNVSRLVIPHLLVPEINRALATTDAHRALVLNLARQRGFISTLEEHGITDVRVVHGNYDAQQTTRAA